MGHSRVNGGRLKKQSILMLNSLQVMSDLRSLLPQNAHKDLRLTGHSAFRVLPSVTEDLIS